MTYEQSLAGLKNELSTRGMGNLARNPFFSYSADESFAAHWTNSVSSSPASSLVGTPGTPSHELTMPSGAIVESAWSVIGSGQDSLPLPVFTLSLYSRCTNPPPNVLRVDLVSSTETILATANFTPGTTLSLQSFQVTIPDGTPRIKLRITAPAGTTAIRFISLIPGAIEPTIFSPHAITDEEIVAVMQEAVAIGHHHVMTDITDLAAELLGIQQGLQSNINTVQANVASEAIARSNADNLRVPINDSITVHGVKTFDGGLRSTVTPADNQDVVRKTDVLNSAIEPYASIGSYTHQSGIGNAYHSIPVPFVERYHSGVNLDLESSTGVLTVAKSGVYRLTVNMICNGRVSGNANSFVKIFTKIAGLGNWIQLNQDIGLNVSPSVSIDISHPTEWVGYLTAGDTICVMVSHDYYWVHLVNLTAAYLGQPAPTASLTILTGDRSFTAGSTETYPIEDYTVASLQASNSQGAVTWTVVADPLTTLPEATIVSGNQLQGTLTDPGATSVTWTVLVQAQDSWTTVQKLIHITLNAYSAIPLAIGAAAIQSRVYVYTDELPYSGGVLFQPTGGTAPYSYSFADGALSPQVPGATITGTGTLGTLSYEIPWGTPVGIHNYRVRLVLDDSVVGSPVTKDLIIPIQVITYIDGGGCTPAGTSFLLADGTEILVENVKPGMEAWAFDDQTGEFLKSVVKQTFKYSARDLWKIVTSEGEITASWDHRPWRLEARPSYTGRDHFPRVEELRVGEHLKWLSSEGKLVDAQILSVEPTGETADVYHVALANGHIYVAGRLCAHNMKTLDPEV